MSLPKPYYDDGKGIVIYHGDCREILPELPDESIDLVLTDPPYASGARTEAAKNSSGAMVRGLRWASKPMENDQMTTLGFIWLLGFASRQWSRLLPEGGSVLVFTDWRQWFHLAGVLESSNLRLDQMVVWDKLTMGLGHGFRAQHELILHASRGTPTVYDKSRGNVLAFSRDTADWHPSPKPVGLLVALLNVCTHVGGLILDPFMGAGAAPVAAKQHGSRAIGIEIEERYCEIAAKRLAQEVFEWPEEATKSERDDECSIGRVC